LVAVHPQTGVQETISEGGLFVDPTGLVIAADGTIFVSDIAAFGRGGVIAVDPQTGQQRKVSASTEFTRPMGLAMAPDGQVLVAYLDQSKLMRVNPANGEHHAVAPLTRFFSPDALAVDAAGGIFVAEVDIMGFLSAIRHIDAAGTVTDLATNAPPGAVYFGIALAPNGDLFAISNGLGPNNQRVARFRPPDPVPHEVSTNGLMLGIFGVDVDAAGSVLVTDAKHGLLRIDPADGTQTVVTSGGSLVRPFGVAVAS
jgi:streptogramin lyase